MVNLNSLWALYSVGWQWLIEASFLTWLAYSLDASPSLLHHLQANTVWMALPSPSTAIFCLIEWLKIDIKQFTWTFVSNLKKVAIIYYQLFSTWQFEVTSNISCLFKELFKSSSCNYLVWYFSQWKNWQCSNQGFKCLNSDVKITSLIALCLNGCFLVLSLKTSLSIQHLTTSLSHTCTKSSPTAFFHHQIQFLCARIHKNCMRLFFCKISFLYGLPT